MRGRGLSSELGGRYLLLGLTGTCTPCLLVLVVRHRDGLHNSPSNLGSSCSGCSARVVAVSQRKWATACDCELTFSSGFGFRVVSCVAGLCRHVPYGFVNAAKRLLWGADALNSSRVSSRIVVRVQRAIGLASPEKPLDVLLDALFEVAVAAAACAVEADMDPWLTISPRTVRRPP